MIEKNFRLFIWLILFNLVSLFFPKYLLASEYRCYFKPKWYQCDYVESAKYLTVYRDDHKSFTLYLDAYKDYTKWHFTKGDNVLNHDQGHLIYVELNGKKALRLFSEDSAEIAIFELP